MTTLPRLIELEALKQDPDSQAELRARCQGAKVIDYALMHIAGKVYLDPQQQKTLGLLLQRVLAPLAPTQAEAEYESPEAAALALAKKADPDMLKFVLERKEGWVDPGKQGALSGANVVINWPLQPSKLEQ